MAVRHADASGGYITENQHDEKTTRETSELAKEDQGQQVKNSRTNGGRQNDLIMKLDENRTRDIHVGQRGSEAAAEEQPDQLRKTVRFEQEAPSSSAAASSDPTVALEYPASGETQSRPASVLVQKSGHIDDDVQISALVAFYEMDGRKSRHIGDVLEWYRGEDARDLKRSELYEVVENLTCLNAFEGNIWKSDPMVVMDDKIHRRS